MKKNCMKKIEKRLLALLLSLMLVLNGSIASFAEEEQTPVHEHTAECYTNIITDELICEVQETDDHVHGDSCYKWEEKLTCTEETSAELQQEDPVEEDPVVEDPVEEEPVVEDPVEEEPVVEDPVEEQPAEDPVEEEPVVEDPVEEEPVVEESLEPAVAEVIEMIDPLPTMDEYFAVVDPFYEAEDWEAVDTYLVELAKIAHPAFEAYSALTEEQQAQVSNWEKLEFIYGLCADVTFASPQLYFGENSLLWTNSQLTTQCTLTMCGNAEHTHDSSCYVVKVNGEIPSEYGANGLVLGLQDAEEIIISDYVRDNTVYYSDGTADGVIKTDEVPGHGSMDQFKDYGLLPARDALIRVDDESEETKNTLREQYYLIYKNVGYYKGKQIDLKMSLVDYELSPEGNGLGVKYGLFGLQTIVVNGQRVPGVSVFNISWIEFKYEFFDAATNAPIFVKGNTSYYDVDNHQAVYMQEGCKGIYVTAGKSIDIITDKNGNRNTVSNDCVLKIGQINGTGYGIYDPVFFPACYDSSADTRYAFTEIFEGSSFNRVFSFEDDDYGGIGYIGHSGFPVEREGVFHIKKTVEDIGNGIDANKEFEFRITTEADIEDGTYGDLTFTEKVATIKLKHGEAAQAAGVPANSTFMISEVNYAGYIPSVNGEVTNTVSIETLPLNEITEIPVASFVNTPMDVISDKTVHGTNTDDLTIDLEVFATGKQIKIPQTTPTDIVLVLDYSHSMLDAFDGTKYNSSYNDTLANKTAKITTLMSAVNTFIDSVSEHAITNNYNHRVGVVVFGNAAETKSDLVSIVGNEQKIKTELYVDHQMDMKGSTNIYLGLENAENMLKETELTDERNKIVVVFTDGYPGNAPSETWRDFESEAAETGAANKALPYANRIKNDCGATIYTIGVLDDADPSVEAGGANVNTFLHYISSNYPTAINMKDGGTGGGNTGHYFAAHDAEALKTIFEEISTEVVGKNQLLSAQSVLRDALTEEFQLDSTTTRQIQVYTADCIGKGTDGYLFEAETDWTEITDQVTVNPATGDYESTKEITVTGYDYGADENLVSVVGEPVGKKLIVRVPILPSDTNASGIKQATNSHAELESNGEIVATFPDPFVDVPTTITVKKIVDGPEEYRNFTINSNYVKFNGYEEIIIRKDNESNYLQAKETAATKSMALAHNETDTITNVIVGSTLKIKEVIPEGYEMNVEVYQTVDGVRSLYDTYDPLYSQKDGKNVQDGLEIVVQPGMEIVFTNTDTVPTATVDKDVQVKDWNERTYDITISASSRTYVIDKAGMAAPVTKATVKDYIDSRFEVIEESVADGDIVGTDEDGTYVKWEIQKLNPAGVNGEPGWSRTFTVKAKPEYIGGNDVTTNGPDSNVTIEGEDEPIPLPRPTVNVKVDYQVGDEEHWIYKGDSIEGLFTDTIIENITRIRVPDNWAAEEYTNLTDVEERTVQWYTDKDCTNEITVDQIRAASITEDTVYYAKVTVTPKVLEPSEESMENTTASSGVVHKVEPISQVGTYTVHVVKGELQITKTLDAVFSEDWTFTFNITKDGEDFETVTVTVPAGSKSGSYAPAAGQMNVLTDLSRGEYVVTEVVPDEFLLKSVTIGEATNCQSTSASPAATFKLGYDAEGNDIIVNGNLREGTYTVDDDVKTITKGILGTVTYLNIEKNLWQIVKRSGELEKGTNYLSGAEFILKEQLGSGETGRVYYGKSVDNNDGSNNVNDGLLKWYTDAAYTQEVAVRFPNGTYELTEVKAPNGYFVYSGQWILTIRNGMVDSVMLNGVAVECTQDANADNQNVFTYYFNNYPIYELPEAGGNGIYWYMLSGILLMMSGVLMIYKNKRKEVLCER